MESSRAHRELPERFWPSERGKPFQWLSGMNACLASFASSGEGRQKSPPLHVQFVFLCFVVPVIPFTRGQGVKGYPLYKK